MIAGCIHSDMHNAYVAELMLSANVDHRDGKTAAAARMWWLPLVMMQRVRVVALLPLAAVTGPMLAITEGIDAFNSALNVMAILFILDVDDLFFPFLLSGHQQRMVEAIEFSVPHSLQRAIDFVAAAALVATLLSTLLIIIITKSIAEDISNAEPLTNVVWYSTHTQRLVSALRNRIFHWHDDGGSEPKYLTHLYFVIISVLSFASQSWLFSIYSAITKGRRGERFVALRCVVELLFTFAAMVVGLNIISAAIIDTISTSVSDTPGSAPSNSTNSTMISSGPLG